ncbi:hypothetical protein KP509_20G008800 [Ceratopteris richardii]|uniref:Pentatricopeptide repeat-containing protein n=1 Tax=Ceratopteris richardii TaxID=49495 RepID=A0A8T2SEY9_CERRI|nr:hypothetical protein KP509_20G008800 [Ceratopteris richardii]
MRLDILLLLKDCTKNRDMQEGIKLHTHICASGLFERDIYLGNLLISFYAKCGVVNRAEQVFCQLPTRDEGSWSALITAYVQMEQGYKALACYDQIKKNGLAVNAIIYSQLLKACGMTAALDQGKLIHDELLSQGLLRENVVLGTALVSMYAKCGDLTKARSVLDDLDVSNEISWSALIVGYMQKGHGKESLACFHQMREYGHIPNIITYICILKACGIIQDIRRGKQIDVEIVIQGFFQKNVMLGTALVDMYIKCRALMEAQERFDQLSTRNVVCWSALIAGYVQQGQSDQALNLFYQMQMEGVDPNAVTYACILRVCGITGTANVGEQIHDKVKKIGLLEKDTMLGKALVDMYGKCSMLEKAQQMHDDLLIRDVVSWSMMINNYAEHGFGEEALDCYELMKREGISPNEITYIYALKACGILRAVEKGEHIHDEIIAQGFKGENVVLGTALIDMYAKCGVFAKAREVLEGLLSRNTVSWNSLIAGYLELGYGRGVLECLRQMRNEGLSPDIVTYVCTMKACGITQEVDVGKMIHDEIVDKGLLKKELVLGNALIDMYSKCGMILQAQNLFDELHARDVVSWNALIAGYVQQGLGEEAVDCLTKMSSDCIFPNAITFSCMLKACSITRDDDKGKQVHHEVITRGLFGEDISVDNALVDMYARCDLFIEAEQVLQKIPIRDVVSWNALIASYAEYGQDQEALACFERMKVEGLTPDIGSWNAVIEGHAQQGNGWGAMGCFKQMQCNSISPDAISFLCILKACSHSGLVDEGQMYITKMIKEFSIIPDIEHNTCIVDMFGRTGDLCSAMIFIETMWNCDHPTVWSALLGSCQRWGELQLGNLAFANVQQLDEYDASAYINMINICSMVSNTEELH